MVFDPVSLKTEALLLFCRDLIETYENDENNLFSMDEQFLIFINQNIENLKKGINAIVQKNDYYLRNIRMSRIKMVLYYYEFINKTITNFMKKDNRFDPSMLCFSMLATWFKEFEVDTKSNQYVFFSIYPYGEIYDKFLIENKNETYKLINLQMIDIAEKTMLKLYKEK